MLRKRDLRILISDHRLRSNLVLGRFIIDSLMTDKKKCSFKPINLATLNVLYRMSAGKLHIAQQEIAEKKIKILGVSDY